MTAAMLCGMNTSMGCHCCVSIVIQKHSIAIHNCVMFVWCSCRKFGEICYISHTCSMKFHSSNWNIWKSARSVSWTIFVASKYNSAGDTLFYWDQTSPLENMVRINVYKLSATRYVWNFATWPGETFFGVCICSKPPLRGESKSSSKQSLTSLNSEFFFS